MCVCVEVCVCVCGRGGGGGMGGRAFVGIAIESGMKYSVMCDIIVVELSKMYSTLLCRRECCSVSLSRLSLSTLLHSTHLIGSGLKDIPSSSSSSAIYIFPTWNVRRFP